MRSPTWKPGLGRGRTRLDEADARGMFGPSEGHEQAGEDHDGE